VLFDKTVFVYFISKIYQYFSTGNDQPREPALCQLYLHFFTCYLCYVAIHVKNDDEFESDVYVLNYTIKI